MKRFFEFAIIILIGNNLFVVNGFNLVEDLLMRSSSLRNQPGIASKDACDNCKLGMGKEA